MIWDFGSLSRGVKLPRQTLSYPSTDLFKGMCSMPCMETRTITSDSVYLKRLFPLYATSFPERLPASTRNQRSGRCFSSTFLKSSPCAVTPYGLIPPFCLGFTPLECYATLVPFYGTRASLTIVMPHSARQSKLSCLRPKTCKLLPNRKPFSVTCTTLQE